MLKWSQSKKEQLLEKYESILREEAIRRAKSKIALAGEIYSEYSNDQLEVIVAEEEYKYKQELKSKSLLGLLIILGIGNI